MKRARRLSSLDRGLHLAAWSMMGAVALFVAVTATLVPVIVWAMAPPDRNTAELHLHLAGAALGPPLGLLAVSGALAVVASAVVFGIAAALLRAPQDEAALKAVDAS